MDRRTRLIRPRGAVVAIAALVAAVAPATPALAADPVAVVFSATGAEQTWMVPDGVSSIHAVLVGGRGGDAGAASGMGHAVTGDLAVAAGTTLYIEVGGNGAGSIGQVGAVGGFNGGGAGGPGTQNAGAGGGGASDIRTVSRSSAGTLESRLIVAAGGGGRGGTDNVGLDPSAGGSAGSDGSAGGGPGTPGLGGGAGTSLAGGAGGAGVSGGAAGALGIGGAGSDGGVQGNGGGGGGGGYYGGGGGGGGSQLGSGGGGGGGSSFTGSASSAFVSPDSSGTPSITITYVVGPGPTPPPAGEGVVDAVINMADATVCIELSTSVVDFGTGQFGEVAVVGSPEIVVTNCSDVWLTLHARGTDATGVGAAWTLVNDTATCADTLGLDRYHLGLHENQAVVDWRLGATNTELEDIAAGSPGRFNPTMDTACPGSSGAGQQMSMQIVFVATEAVP